MEEDEEQDIDFVFCTGRFSEDHNGEDKIRCAKCFVLSFHPLYLHIFHIL